MKTACTWHSSLGGTQVLVFTPQCSSTTTVYHQTHSYPTDSIVARSHHIYTIAHSIECV